MLALGTLLAVELKDEGGGGYQSKASAVVRPFCTGGGRDEGGGE